MSDPTDIEQQEALRREEQERAHALQLQETDDLKWLMGAKRGRRIVHRQLERAGVFQLSFNTNAMTMAFNEGRRNEGLALTNKLMVSCPEQWALMIKENALDE
jgi:hypothetical protein